MGYFPRENADWNLILISYFKIQFHFVKVTRFPISKNKNIKPNWTSHLITLPLKIIFTDSPIGIWVTLYDSYYITHTVYDQDFLWSRSSGCRNMTEMLIFRGRGESGRSNWMKVDGPKPQKWTALGQSGRPWVKVDGPKGHKVDSLRKRSSKTRKWTVHKEWNWTILKSAWVVKKGGKWTVCITCKSVLSLRSPCCTVIRPLNSMKYLKWNIRLWKNVLTLWH